MIASGKFRYRGVKEQFAPVMFFVNGKRNRERICCNWVL
jgi:hypothetical protein